MAELGSDRRQGEATQPRRAGRGRLWLFRLAAILLGLSPLVVFEAVCVLLDWGRPNLHDDPFVGFRATRPLFVLNDEGTRYEVPKARYRYFAPESFAAKKARNEFRVFCLGGSTVQGEPFEFETSFTTWLEIGLQAADPSRHWEVVNCGGVSYATYRLVPILQEVLRYSPDLIIFYEGHNEFLESRTYDHIEGRGRVLNAALESASRLRTFTLAREGYLRLQGTSSADPPRRRPMLPTEVEALLDNRGGLEEYHHNEAWRRGVIDHFRLSLSRIVQLTREAGVPLILVNPVSNLADSPPFKSEHRADLSAAELTEWESLCEAARLQLHADNRDLHKAARLFERACQIDPLHAGAFYNLAKCYDAAGDFDKARAAYLQAKELDVCPLRILQPMNEAVLEIAHKTGTPLVDAQRLFEGRSRNGIVGGDWLVDHVHPKIEGHQLLADALTQMLISLDKVRPQSGWEQVKQQRFREHFDSLGGLYFVRGMERLKRLQGWAAGRAGQLVADDTAKDSKEPAESPSSEPPPQRSKESGRRADSPTPPHGSKTPAAEHDSFQLADPDLEIELVAAEPDVVSPVSIAWDADGRMYAAEMIGYPTTEGQCRIALLEDHDGDGRYQRTSTFAESLSFVTSVMPFREGVLVTSAPDLLFLADADGDGRADVRRVEWTGFGTGSQQLRANALHWSLDNWIYGANGRCDGDIVRPGGAGSPITIRTRDFRFHPGSARFEAIVGQSQFGQAHDDWGNRFLCWNTVPIRHVVVEDRYLKHCPQRVSDVVVDVTEPGDTGAIYPLSPPPRQFNTEQANYYNAMCGLTIYRGDRLGRGYEGNAFVCESLTNLVTRRMLEPAGPTFVSRRVEKDREFLASADSWFHPVNLTTGPDGALYVVDFYREFVEHPIYVSDAKARAETDWREGAEHGRIWRIRRRDGTREQRRPRLQSAATPELVESLGHPVGWWRETAQRLLFERRDPASTDLLRGLARESSSPLVRLHAVWTLDGLDSLDEPTLLAALRDAHPGVREHAVRLAEGRLIASGDLRGAILAMSGDRDPRVRFQVALSLGSLDSSQTAKALAGLVGDGEDRWMSLAVLCGAAQSPGPLLQLLTSRHEWLESLTPPRAQFLEQAAGQLAARRDASQIEACSQWLVASRTGNLSPGRLAVLAGLAKHLGPEDFSAGDGRKTAEDIQKVGELTDAVARAAVDKDLADWSRARAIEILARWRPAASIDVLLAAMRPGQPPDVQTAAARATALLGDKRSPERVYQGWHELAALPRQEVLASAPRSALAAGALLDAIEQGIVLPNELSAAARSALAASAAPELKQRIDALLGGSLSADREQVVKKFQDVTHMRGDQRSGAALFKEHCKNCHPLQGIGSRIGPDLSAIGSRRNDILLIDILDPGRTVSPDFVNYVLVTKQGQVLSGLLAAETTDSVTLRLADGNSETISRGEIQELRATGKSFMPEGLEEKLSRQQLADLLEFLRRPEGQLLK